MTEAQQKESIGFICLMLGALTVLAPKENESLQCLLKDIREWMNAGVIEAAQQAEKKTD